MKKKVLLLLLLLAAACLLSCRKGDLSAQPFKPNGAAGASVDSQGSLAIDAPVYVAVIRERVISEGMEDVELQPADEDLFLEIESFFPIGEADNIRIASGTISGGRISIAIPIPGDEHLYLPESWFNPEWVKSGSDIGCRLIRISSGYSSLRLHSNLKTKHGDFGEAGHYIISGDFEEWYEFVYSEGDVVVSGTYSGSGGDGYDYHEITDVKLTQGWNTVGYSYRTDNEAKTITRTETSKNPPPDAVWVRW